MLVWTEYKAKLLCELYQRTLDLLHGFSVQGIWHLNDYRSAEENSGELYHEGIALKRVELVKKFSKLDANSNADWEEAKKYVATLPDNYLQTCSKKAIYRHGMQVQKLAQAENLHDNQLQKKCLISILPQEIGAKIEFISHWDTKCFTDFAAILSLSGSNTLSANLFRIGNIYVVAAFHILHFPKSQQQAKILEDIAADVLADDALAYERRIAPLREKITNRCSQTHSAQMPNIIDGMMAQGTLAQGTVNFYLNDSEIYTIVEVNGVDRQGLLYELSDALSHENVQINIAKIATFGEHVIDVFYIKDEFGFKVTDAKRLENIRKNLLTILT